MQQAYLDDSMLPWSVDPVEARRYRRLLLVLAALALMIGIAIPVIQLPERVVAPTQDAEAYLAQVILDLPQPEVIEPEIPVVEEAETPVVEEPEIAEEVAPPVIEPVVQEPRVAPEPKPEPEPVDKVEAAREVAKSSGLLALNEQLAGMRDAAAASGYKVEAHQGNQPAQRTEERLVSNAAIGTSGGVDDLNLTTKGEQVALEGRATTRLDAPISTGSAGQGVKKAAAKMEIKRTDDEIRRMFDANRSALYSLYQRALRSNPTLQGTVLVELTITPAGVVSNCKIVSSELQDAELERRLMARIKLINFGAKDVPEGVYTYSLGFLPG